MLHSQLVRKVACIALILGLVGPVRASTSYTDTYRSRLVHTDYIQQYASWLGIPVELLMTVQILETGWVPLADKCTVLGADGEVGIYQIMPYHAKGFGYKVVDLYNPKINTEIASKLLRDRYIKYDGDIANVLASYNGGHYQAVLQQQYRCSTTKAYVERGLKIYKELRK